jgi:hypothetical protein
MIEAILSVSKKPNKKYTVLVSDGKRKKTIHFGSKAYQDFTQHKNNIRKSRYISRHQKNEEWEDAFTPGFWAKNLLWNLPTIEESIDDIQKQHDIHIKGGNFIKFVKSIPGRITGFITGRGNQYPPQCREFLAKNGNNIISSLTVYRAPVQAFIKPILNAISLGEFQRLLNKNGYDKLYHLYCRITFANTDMRLEKNEVIKMTQPFTDENDSESLNIPLKQTITINELLNNTEKFMGNKYFTYSAFNNNCQNYILSILEANNISFPEAKTFILQDMTDFKTNLPSATKTIARTTTDLASRIDILVNGGQMKLIKKLRKKLI